LALLAAPSVFAASAKGAPTELLVHFVMPGRDIECLMVDPNVPERLGRGDHRADGLSM